MASGEDLVMAVVVMDVSGEYLLLYYYLVDVGSGSANVLGNVLLDTLDLLHGNLTVDNGVYLYK